MRKRGTPKSTDVSRMPSELYAMVEKKGVSMCGVIPATVMLMVCNKMGAKACELVKYMTSGEVSGDFDHVVGYAGIIIQ